MIIALTGYKKTGKDTIADYLVEKYGFIKLSFAENLKNILKTMFNWTDEHFSQKLKEINDPIWNVSPREMMQFFGTNVIRNQLKINTNINDKQYNYHIKKLYLDNIHNFKNKNIVISDLRFHNEQEFIHSLNGKIFRIDRKIIKNSFSLHESESYIKDIKYDLLINNNNSLLDTLKTIDEHIAALDDHSPH